MRIVADTNTLISGSLWSGNPGRLLDAVKAGKLKLVQTPRLWVEFVEVLNRPKFLARLQLLGLTPTMLADGLRQYVARDADAEMPPRQDCAIRKTCWCSRRPWEHEQTPL